ncbi:hypothetical protein IWW36_005123, partial [Coemansia brasiliensis]
MLQVFYDKSLELNPEKGSDTIDVYVSMNLKQIVEILNKRLTPLGIKEISYTNVELVIHETTSSQLRIVRNDQSLISANIRPVETAGGVNTATL